MVECLLSLERPLGLNHRGKGGQTAMIVAASRGNSPVQSIHVKYYQACLHRTRLKDNGFVVCAGSDLHFWYVLRQILDCLSREYPCMAIKDKKKMTALAWAARNGHAGAVR